MPRDPIPKDPVYMTYVTNHNQDITRATPERSTSPYRPATGLTHTELQLQSSRGVYQHFHRPFNDHSRFLTTASPAQRAALRDTPRVAPPPWDGSRPGQDRSSSPRRPASAPSAGRRSFVRDADPRASLTLEAGGAGSLLDNLTTRTGVPCFTVSSLVEADLVSGTPVLEPSEEPEQEAWRVARVQTYQVPPSQVGYGDGAARPFHQDYRHYKYYGFAGHGAKTSWAHNPKYSKIYAHVMTGGRDSKSPVAGMAAPPPEPLQEVVGGPRRSLTAGERKLIKQFKEHNYDSEGRPSDPKVAEVLEDIASGRQPDSDTLRLLELKARRWRPEMAEQLERQQRQRQQQRAAAAAAALRRSRERAGFVGAPPQVEVIEPFNTKVDLDLRRSLPSETSLYGNSRAARVTTYRQMPSPYAGELNTSPQHGSQSPWHQRYSHYKYSGFAGKGATSSWARNPKYAKMYD